MPATVHQPSRWRSVVAWVAVVVLSLLAAGMTSAAEPPPPAPTHRELWVPEQSLAAALQTMPKAVLLTREQFQILLRDTASRNAADPHTPPVPAVLRTARYAGSLGERAALLTAEFVIDGLDDVWTELPLTLDPRWLGAVTVDGTTAVSATDQAAVLVVRGAGRHVVRMDFAAPIIESAGSKTLILRSPGTVEASLVLSVPESLKLESAIPFHREQNTATFALPPGRDEFQLHWTARDVPPLEIAGIFQDCRFVYSIDAAQIRADLTFGFHSELKLLPGLVTVPVPAGSEILAVDGTELARWSLAGDTVLVEFQAGDRRESDLRVQLSLPVDDGATELDLPAPLASGMHRASGVFTLLGHPGLRVRRVTTGLLTARDDTRSAPAFAERPDFLGTWAFPVLREPPRVEIERLTSRFTATLDTQITLARNAIQLTRHLSFQPRDGALFSPRLTGLLMGEEIDTVTLAGGGEIPWRLTDGGLSLITPAGTAPGQSLNVVVTSTLRPAGWNQLGDQATALSLTSAQLPGAEKISGYLALDFDESLRVTTPKTDGLEPRDPRQFAGKLPLTGRLAWFRLDAFQLDLTVARRVVEFDAAVALDVLPLLNSLEVEGQLNLAIAHGGLRELAVAFPAAMAASVRWESPLIAEKSMTEDGRWVLRFHQETTGAPHLRFHASLPLTDSSAAGAGERRFAAQVPFPSVVNARRSAGTLVVEANSDTELTFAPQALDDLDTRHAPAIDGYAPRHRLVAGYAWRGGQPALAIDGIRHRPGELAGTVVDSLALDSVVSADGPTRHQAVIAIRSAGAQFLDVSLPAQARVLSVVIDGLAAKPVRGPQGALRLPLPSSQVQLRIIYESPAEPMTSQGGATLPPLTLAPTIPVLDTLWRLHLPEGFSYSGFDTNLTEKTAPPPPPSLARAIMNAPLVAALFSDRHHGRVLMEIERSSGVTAGDFYDPRSGSKAMLGSETFLPTEFKIITSKETLAQVIQKRNLVERWKVADLDEAYAKLSRMVKTSQEPGTDLVSIEVTSPDKTEASELANDVAEAYIARRQHLESERVRLGFETLSHTRKSQEQEVERARNKMLEIVQELGIVDLSAPLVMDAHTALAKKHQVDEFKAQLNAIKDKEGEDLISAAANLNLLDPKTTALYNTYLQDQRTAAQLESSGLTEDHPEIVMVRSRMQVQKEQLDAAVNQLKEGSDRQERMYEQRLKNIENITDKQKDINDIDRGKYAQFQQAKDQYGMAQEILNKMIDEQERARVVNLMPRKPATIHRFADAGDDRKRVSAVGALQSTNEPQSATSVLAVSSPSPAGESFRDTELARDGLIADTRDHTRARALREVDGEWESAPAVPATGPREPRVTRPADSDGGAENTFALPAKQMSGGTGGGGRPAMRAGLLPLDFSLPEGGRTLTFAGKFAPTPLSFRAESWDRQVRLAWVWILSGGVVFFVLNLRFRRPIFVGLLGALTLHFAPLVAAQAAWTPIANALLTGWLIALGIALAIAVVKWAATKSVTKEAPSHV